MKRNVLIFHSGALGDFIVTWPLAVALGRLWPHSRIIYVAASQKGQLAQRIVGTEYSDADAGWHQLFAIGADPDPAILEKLTNAHHVLSFISNGSDKWSQNVRRIAPEAELICIQPRPLAPYSGHISQFFLEQLSQIPPVRSATAAIIRGLVNRPIAPVAIRPSHVVIHPGAGATSKCWPTDNYLELIDWFNQLGRPVRVILGEVERERWPTSLIAEFDRLAEVRWPADYAGLFETLRSASVFIGNDSGPAHLSGIIGLPSVVLFGHASALWQPMGPRVNILQRPFSELSVDLVRQTITPHLGVAEMENIP